MLKLFKAFLREEDGIGTVEIVLIIAALVAVALLFRKAITDFIKESLDKIFKDAKEGI